MYFGEQNEDMMEEIMTAGLGEAASPWFQCESDFEMQRWREPQEILFFVAG